MDITTSTFVPGMEIDHILDIVCGVDGYTITEKAGATLANQEVMYADGLSRARLKMQQKAIALNADAIIDVHHSAMTAGNQNTVLITVTGTAVKLRMTEATARQLAVEVEKKEKEESERLAREAAERAAQEEKERQLQEERLQKEKEQKMIESNKERVIAVGKRTASGLGLTVIEGTVIAALATNNIPLSMADLQMYLNDVDTMDLINHVKGLQDKDLIQKTDKGYILKDAGSDEMTQKAEQGYLLDE